NRLPYFSARLIGYFGNCSSLRRIRIISSPATRHAVAIFSRRSTAASSTNCIADIEDWSVVGISRKSLAVTVSNRARRVDKLCSQYAADGLQSLSRLNWECLGEPERDRKVRGVHYADQHAAVFNEASQVRESTPSEPGPHIVRFINLAEIRRIFRGLPRQRISPHRHALNNS